MIQQTSSKIPAQANVFKIHVLMLDVCCYTHVCYNGRASWMFASRLLNRVNTL